MRYRLNFSSPSVDKQKRRVILRFTTILYIMVCIFSGYVLFQVYNTQNYMANVYQTHVSEIERKISEIEPRVLFLENKIAERNRLLNQASLYVQENSRPSVWYARLVDLARLLPPDLILTKVMYDPPEKKDPAKPDITIDGYMIITGNEQEIFAVDDLRSTLAESLPTKFNYTKLQVESNRIYKEEDYLKLVFSLGYYR